MTRSPRPPAALTWSRPRRRVVGPRGPATSLSAIVDWLLAPKAGRTSGPPEDRSEEPGGPGGSSPSANTTPDALERAQLERLLAEVGTQLWRMRRQMVEPGTDRAQEPMRRPFRHLSGLQDTLCDAGLETIDHTGQTYDPGMSLTVVACEQRAGLDREQIAETLRPTVVLQGRRIQVGEVILAIPQDSSPDEATPTEGPSND